MSLITDLPAIFDQFSEARQKRLSHRHGSQGARHSAGCTYCTFMPQEIPMAAGAVVVSLCSTSDETMKKRRKICRATSAR
ncbi:2-hydroxyglutaryl-CoA dehydratase [Escherichia coli]|uniref:2-hydroxyglutaryl-CoA dehydratase n=1 Tax=Escherichia coli TaxID=562 RepID=A0A377AQC1_ECOLX|nr:2-hydroxyglutaryl-CoA dehydratase [Escherichia coli]